MIQYWHFLAKSECAMNRSEIIHEMNKFFLILFVLTASVLSIALWGLIIITILHLINGFIWYDKALYSLGIISIVLMFFLMLSCTKSCMTIKYTHC